MWIGAGLILIEFIISKGLGKNYYQMRDFFCNLGVGLVFILVSIFQFGYNSYLYKFMLDNISLFSWEQQNLLTKAIAIIVWEFCYYWMHRSFHTVPFMWAGHSAHHSSNELNLATTFRRSCTTWIYHPLFFAPMAVMGFSWTSFNIAASFSVAWGFCTHTRLIPNLGFLETIFVGPSCHRVHHGKNDPYLNKNHGSFLIIWDRIFKTYQKEIKKTPVEYGVRIEKPTFNPFKVNLLPYLPIKSNHPKSLNLNFLSLYYILQFAALIFFIFYLQLNFSPARIWVPGIFVAFSLSNLGEMLDGKSYAIKLEILRHGIFIFFITDSNIYPLVTFIALSLLILVSWIRPSNFLLTR